MEVFKCRVSYETNTLEAIRYAAYAQTSDCWAYISCLNDKEAEVSFFVKTGKEPGNVIENFLKELEDEKIREKSRKENISAEEYIIGNLLKQTSVSAEDEECDCETSQDNALSPEQEAELDALIAEVEKELQSEAGDLNKDNDPQNITKTWEEMNKNE